MLELDPGQRDRLRRIYTRACADCEVPKATVGTGAPSTRKRALAVQMALDGAGLDDRHTDADAAIDGVLKAWEGSCDIRMPRRSDMRCSF